MRLYLLAAGACFLCCFQTAFAQTKVDTVSDFKVQVNVPKRFYAGNGLDLAMLSTAFVSKPGSDTKITMPRFTAVVNLGFTFYYDLNERFGLMSGIGVRNMGFIEKDGDVTYKRRVYALGIPLGIKFGDLRNRNFAFGGAGIDLPFHYKEKAFEQRSSKTKRSDWFGDQTPRVLPFFFAGHSWDPGITVKLQYYPTNFINPDYAEDPGVSTNIHPFAGHKVNLLLLSVGIDIHYGQYKIQEREYREMKKKKEENKLL